MNEVDENTIDVLNLRSIILDVARHGYAELFILKKTYSKFAEKSREVFFANLDGEVVDLYRDILIQSVEKLTEDSIIIDFFDEKPCEEYISVINQDDHGSIPILVSVIDKILGREQNCNSFTVFNDKTLNQLHSYAVKFNTASNGEVIYFRKYGSGYKIDKTIATLVFNNGKFDKVKGDVFKCDRGVDGIFYQNSEKLWMIVFNDLNFEDIFSFYEIYLEQSRIAFDTLSESGVVQIEPNLFNEIQDKNRYLKKIALLNKKNFFNSLDIQSFKTTRDKVKSLNFDVSEDSIIITSKEALKDFLDVCENKILQDLNDDQRHYRVSKKEQV